MTVDYDGRRLAAELVQTAAGQPIDIARVAHTLCVLADRLEAALKAANDLSQSMDSVHLDRVQLADMVSKLSDERDSYKRQVNDACVELAA